MYRIVCPAKYRRTVITEEVDKKLREICLGIEARYEIKFLEIGVEVDHVHSLVQSVPKYSPKQIVQTIKSLTARKIYEACPDVKKASGCQTPGAGSLKTRCLTHSCAQADISPGDFALIPFVLNEFDKAEYYQTDKKGNKKLLFQKNCEGTICCSSRTRNKQSGGSYFLENAHPRCLVLTISGPLELTSETTLGGYL